jgi:hypothetical protein
MLKLFFWLLLFANVAAFVLNLGASTAAESGKEPDRIANQLNAERITLRNAEPPASAPVPVVAASSEMVQPPQQTVVPPAQQAPQPDPQQAAVGQPAPEQPAPQQTAAAPQRIACLEIGDFSGADIRRFEARLAELQLGDRLSRRTAREISSYIVFIPSQGSQEAALGKVAELQAIGITDYFVIQEGPLQWGISLGVFKNEEASRTHLALLKRRGVDAARIAARKTNVNRFVYQMRDIGTEVKVQVESWKEDFPSQQTRACTSVQSEPTLIAGN